MAKSTTNKIQLDQKDFERYPVWAWNSSMDGLVPILDYDPLPIDRSTLFVKANLLTASEESIDGYVMGLVSIYGAGLFIGGEEYVVNLNIQQSIDMAQAKACEVFDREVKLLPLRYRSSLHFAGKPPLRGTLRARKKDPD